MDVSIDSLVEGILAAEGPVLMVGAPDTGKTTLAARLAKAALSAGRPAAVIDLDVGQSEVGPPGLMDLAPAEAEAPMSKWRPRGQWYIGSTSPLGALPQTVAGARRLADRAAERGFSPVIVDTPSFVPIPAGIALTTALVDVLKPGLVVAVQIEGEIERWLRGIGAPVARVVSDPNVRSKPSGLRATRRGARLGAYFQDSTEHSIRLTEWTLRNTRLGAGAPMPHTELAQASTMLGCPVVHGERAPASVAFWTLGAPRHDPARIAAEFGAPRAVTFDASVWKGRSLGFIARDGFCLAMGVVTDVDWPSLIATVRAPVYSVAEAVAISAGQMRHRPDGEELPAVPDRDA